MGIVGTIGVLAVAAGLMFVVDKFISKSEFNLVDTLTRIVTVLVVVFVAQMVAGKLPVVPSTKIVNKPI